MTWAGIPETAPMAPFLKRSAAVHGVLMAAAFWAAGRQGKAPEPVYRIDFIGGSQAIMNREKAGAAPAAPAAPLPPPSFAKPERQKDPDAFSLKPSFKPLPKPSFLDAARPEPASKPSALPSRPSMAPAAGAPASGAAGAGPGDGLGSVSADMPDFPYPWYLTSLRQRLWERWSQRMPPYFAECVVQFSILRDGSLVDVRVEETSGDGAFDSAAAAAVKAAGPLAPLPPQFKERFLKVHVQFKTR